MRHKSSLLSRLRHYFSNPRNIVSVLLFVIVAIYLMLCNTGAVINVFQKEIAVGVSGDLTTIGMSGIDGSNATTATTVTEKDNDLYKFKISIVDCCLFGALMVAYGAKKIYDKRKQKRRDKR